MGVDDRTGIQWEWMTGLVFNDRTGIQWEWMTGGLVFNGSG